MLPTIAREGDAVVMIDQRKLPAEEIYVHCKSAPEVARAIRTMVIRGAPAIGVAAAMGIALGMQRSKATGTQKFAAEFHKACELLAATRPTAVNLFWAIDRMRRAFAAAALAGESVDQIKDQLDAESAAIHDEDVASCRAFGAAVVPADARVLTHCNAGALATPGYGTALGVIRGAVEIGKHVVVFADETRPFLQGARLTAWELVRDGIQTTVITDNMSAALMQKGKVDLVIVGADRIAANGDTANKIGTYGVAVLARHHGVPFYVAAPWSTIDPTLPAGAAIPIEERDGDEVRRIGAQQTAPARSPVFNPAFDVTPASLITAIITERGIFRPPYLFNVGGSDRRSSPTPPTEGRASLVSSTMRARTRRSRCGRARTRSSGTSSRFPSRCTRICRRFRCRALSIPSP